MPQFWNVVKTNARRNDDGSLRIMFTKRSITKEGNLTYRDYNFDLLPEQEHALFLQLRATMRKPG